MNLFNYLFFREQYTSKKMRRTLLQLQQSRKIHRRASSHTKRAGLWNRTTPLYWFNTACTITPCPLIKRKL